MCAVLFGLFFCAVYLELGIAMIIVSLVSFSLFADSVQYSTERVADEIGKKTCFSIAVLIH